MPKISIYAASPETRETIASILEAEADLEVHDGGDRAPRRLDGSHESDVLLMVMDLPPAERLQILGLVWRSDHPPRMLFLECPADAADEDAEAPSPDRLLAVIRSLADGEADCERLSIAFGPAPAERRDATTPAPDEPLPVAV